MGLGCGVRLVSELSSGRCRLPESYGCSLKLGARLFYVRNGCVGTFFCTGLPARDVIEPDRKRSCGSGRPDTEHECDCRWSLPLVVPLHPPRWPAPRLPHPAPLLHPAPLRRYAYGCNLFLSIARPPVLERGSLGSSRLRFVPVFSSDADLDRFARLYGHASVAHGMVVSVGKDIGARSIATQLTSNAPAVRQLVLKWRLPSVTTAPHRPAWVP